MDGMTFQKGHPGGPGRPKGSGNKRRWSAAPTDRIHALDFDMTQNAEARQLCFDYGRSLVQKLKDIIEAQATEMTHKLTAIKLLLDRALPVIDLDKVLDQKMAKELADRLADVRQMAEAHRLKSLELDRAQQRISELEMIINAGRSESDGRELFN
jgi:hypothetical protein